MPYRREIDGLRAVAVLPVILFHAGVGAFGGGYVGVDVFFVISGFLITTILLDDLSAEKFSLTRFYERRARRILPALFFVMAACLPFAWALMMPHQLEDFARSIVAVSFFASNVLFWRQSGYFAPAAEEMPLLHTWSLAVEEQYYLAFPIILFVIFRWGWRAAFLALLAMTLVSFALMEWANRSSLISSSAVFYLIPFRAWELFVGSLCAFLAHGRPQRSNEWLAALGLLLIVGPIFFFDAATPFPSAYTLLPVTGTALVVLFASGATLTGRLLSMRLLVGIGLISYSAYLWHQPLFAFARIRTMGTPDPALMLGLAAASLLLAVLTWRFVEVPARRPGAGLFIQGRTVFAASAFGLAGFAALGVAGTLAEGVPRRMPEKVLAAYAFAPGDTSGCHNKFSARDIAAGKRCIIGAEGIAPSLAFLGDSHMGRLTDGLATVLAAGNLAGVTYNGSFCAPLLDFATTLSDRANCMARMNAAIEAVAGDAALKKVVLFAEWANYTTGGKINGHVKAAYTAVSAGVPINRDVKKNPQAVKAALIATLARLEAAGKQIVLVYPTPAYGFDVPDFIAGARLRQNTDDDLRLPLDDYGARNDKVLEIFEAVQEDHPVRTLDPVALLCTASGCRAVDEAGTSLFEDGNHLSYEGALILAEALLSTATSEGRGSP